MHTERVGVDPLLRDSSVPESFEDHGLDFEWLVCGINAPAYVIVGAAKRHGQDEQSTSPAM